MRLIAKGNGPETSKERWEKVVKEKKRRGSKLKRVIWWGRSAIMQMVGRVEEGNGRRCEGDYEEAAASAVFSWATSALGV